MSEIIVIERGRMQVSEIAWSPATDSQIDLIDANSSNVAIDLPSLPKVVNGEDVVVTPGDGEQKSTTLVLPLLPRNEWTDFPQSDFSRIIDYKVLDNLGNDLSDSFSYRRSGNNFQIHSLTEYTNLQIYLEGE